MKSGSGDLPSTELAFLRDMTRDVVEASRVPTESNACGFTLITPGKKTYRAFWIRDFSLSADCGFITPHELRAHVLLICKVQNGAMPMKLANGLRVPPWAIPDHISYAGRPIWFPGTYAVGPDQGDGTFGRLPPVDDHYEFIHIVNCLCKSGGKAVLKEKVDGLSVLDRLEKAFSSPTIYLETGLVQTSKDDRAVGWGFCDTVVHTGKLLFASLLRWRAAGELAGMIGAPRYVDIQTEIGRNVGPTFGDASGWLRASTGLSNQVDVWGTLFALHLGVLDNEQAAAARKAVVDAVARGTITHEGGVKQVPSDMDYSRTTAWERSIVPVSTYQNGGYWHTASGWLIEAIWNEDRKLALRVFEQMMKHLRREDYRNGGDHGAPWEVFGRDGKARQNAVYMASVAAPYAVLKDLK